MGERRRIPWAVVLVLGVCSVTLFARKSDALLNPQFWAEDGTVYFQGARELGIRSLAALHDPGHVPYLVQRYIALVGDAVPVAFAPHFYAWTSFALTLAVCAFLALRFRRGWLLALAVALVPHDGEVFFTLANLHWILALVLIALAIEDDPVTRAGRVVELLVAAVLSLTGPFALLFLPLFLARFLQRSGRQSGLLLAVVGFCSGWSLGVLHPERTGGLLNPGDPGWLALLESWPSIAVVTAAAIAVLACDWKCAASAYAGAVVWLAAVYAHRYAPSIPASMGLLRYGYIPIVCLCWALVFAWERRAWLRPVCVMVASVTLAVTTFHFFAPPVPDLHWREASRCIDGPLPCDVPINPAPWRISYVPRSR